MQKAWLFHALTSRKNIIYLILEDNNEYVKIVPIQINVLKERSVILFFLLVFVKCHQVVWGSAPMTVCHWERNTMRIHYLTESFSVTGKWSRKIFKNNCHRTNAIDFILLITMCGRLFPFIDEETETMKA